MNPWSRPDSCSGMVLSFLLMLFLVVPISGQNFNLSTDLVAYYPLDLDAKDYSGNCLHGEVYGPTSTINRLDISGKALRFDGKDDFIEVPHSPLLNFTNEEDFAISLWVKLEEGQSDLDTTDNDILSKWVENDLSVEHLATGYPYTLRIINKKNKKKNYFYWAQFGGYNKKCKSEVDPHSKSAIENDAYFHICLNVKSNRFYFYVNGRLERMEGSSVICDPFNTAPMRIGKRGGPNHANHFRGVLDDLAIWGRALTEEEILKISEASFDFKHYLADLIEEQELVKSDTLFFDTDDWQLSKKQKRTISKYFTFLDLAEDYELLIAGHTNNLCEDAFCEELSMKRARIVKEYLHKLGYDCDGISAIGRGKSRQIAPNKYPSTRKLNQRVELGLYKLTKK